MYYLPDEKYALRSWEGVPFAYIKKGVVRPKGLTKETFELLKLCDGKHDIPQSELLLRLLFKGMIRPCDEGEEPAAWQRERHFNNRPFPTMNWAITGKCNMNCKHCFMAKDNSPMMDEFTPEEAENFLSDCENCGVRSVNITGGEPFLHKNFFEIFDSCLRHDIYVSDINTNGVLITKDALNRMAQGDIRPKMKISFDGLGHHEWLRGVRNVEKKTLEAVELCTDNAFEVMIQTNVFKRNVASLAETVRTLEKLGVGMIRLIKTSESRRWRTNSGGDSLSFEEYYDAMLALAEELLAGDMKLSLKIWQFLAIYPEDKTYHIEPLLAEGCSYSPSEPVCSTARNCFAISYTGEIALCNPFAGYMQEKGISYGNVKKTSLSGLLTKGPYFDLVTTSVEERLGKNSECLQCAYKEQCRGGCCALGTAYFDDLMRYDPTKCLFFKKGYPKKITELMNRFGYRHI